MCRHQGMALTCEAGHTDGNVAAPTRMGVQPRARSSASAARRPVRRHRHRRLEPRPRGAGHLVGARVREPRPPRRPLRRMARRPARPHGADRHVPAPRGAPAARVPVASNWKLYIENHVDVLHLWYLHDETLGMYDHRGSSTARSGRTGSARASLSSGPGARDRPRTPRGRAGRAAGQPHLPERADVLVRDAVDDLPGGAPGPSPRSSTSGCWPSQGPPSTTRASPSC